MRTQTFDVRIRIPHSSAAHDGAHVFTFLFQHGDISPDTEVVSRHVDGTNVSYDVAHAIAADAYSRDGKIRLRAAYATIPIRRRAS